MNKPVEWEKRGNEISVANVEYGMKLTVRRESDNWNCNWIWEVGNLSSVFQSGKSDSERTAKESAEYVFQQYQRYAIENIGKCTE